MIDVPTRIDESKLEAWKQRLPERLNRFMDNFFGTCQELDPARSYINYLCDIKFHSIFTKEYRDHALELQQAFYEITGWRPGRDE